MKRLINVNAYIGQNGSVFMIIDVNNFIDGETKDVSFTENISIPAGYCEGDTAKVKISGVISKNDGKYRLKGKVCANIMLKCDLCLEPFNKELNFPIDEIFKESFSGVCDYEDDIWSFSDKKINLDAAALSGILLNIPMKAVCSDGCRGLCAVCGHNLNEGECGCGGVIDSRFEKLKALFEETGEGV